MILLTWNKNRIKSRIRIASSMMLMLSSKIVVGTARSKKTHLSVMKLLLVAFILIGALFSNSIIVLRFEKTKQIHFFTRALSVSRARKPFCSKQSSKPKEFLFYPAARNARIGTTRLEATSSTSSRTIEWIPTRVEFDGVYRSYGPPTIWRKLTSSVPRREFALQDISLGFGKSNQISSNDDNTHEDSLTLLLGASSSGKSTIFRSLLEASQQDDEGKKEFGRAENKGRIQIQQLPLPEQIERAPKTNANPILLDDRVEVNTSSGRAKITVEEAWSNKAMEIMESTISSQKESYDFAKTVVKYLADVIFDLNPETLLVDLTPSEKYRFCLGKACIESSIGATQSNSIAIPGPIILLDEWMDVETSAVIHKVQPSLHKIVEELNGVVLSITHKPELYFGDTLTEGVSTLRRITLSGGKLLSDN